MAKYEKYAEYKDSGVEWLGDIPSHWQSVPCKGVVEHIVEKNTDNALSNYLSLMANVGVIRYEDKGDIGNKKPEDLSKCKIVRKGQLVINSMNYSIGSYGMSPYDGICSPVYIVLQSLSGVYLERFALRIFENSFFQKYLSTFGNGILEHRSAINWDDIKGKYVPLPPLDEQKNILNFLDHETAKIDTLIAKQEKLIELLKEKRQAVISHAVTKGLNPDVAMKDSGVEWIGEVPKHWKVSKLKYESEVVDCRNKTPEYFDDGEYFVVRTTNVKNQELNFNGALYTDKKNFDIWTQRGVPPVGSILFTREAPTGQVCLVPDNLKFCMGQRMMNFISYDSHYGDYLFDYLISDCLDRYINSVSHGSTVTHLRVEQVENIPVLVPGKEEIKEIHLYILKIKQQFNALEQKALETIRLMQERRTALISSAVTGKIDVRNWQYPNEATTELSQ